MSYSNITKEELEAKLKQQRAERELMSRQDEPRFAKNMVELAKILNCKRQSIYVWAKQRGFPARRSNGRYDVEKIRAWCKLHGKLEGKGRKLEEQREDEGGEYAGIDGEQIVELKARKLRAETEIRELELLKLKNDLVPMADAKTFVYNLVNTLSQKIKNAPQNWALRVNPQDPNYARSVLEVFRDEFLREGEEICKKCQK